MNHPDAYKTIAKPGEGDYREKGSKFPSIAFFCDSEESLKAQIRDLKKVHPQARHFCYGAVIGSENPEHRSSDDGEPSGTAGLPILNQILSSELCNAAVIVVRYFGGSKLGKAGLINAYKESTQSAINQCKIKIQFNNQFIEIKYAYDSTSAVQKALESIPHHEVIEQEFMADCKLKIAVPKSDHSNALSSFSNLLNVEIL